MPMLRGTVEVENTENTISDESTPEEVYVKDLTGRVCYFSLAGDLALDAFIQENLSSYSDERHRKELAKEAVSERLYFALLMFDKVVLHCSDPLRSEIVYEVLLAFRDMIKEGRILFIFSKHIKDVKADYRKYIKNKVEEYSNKSGFFSDKEAKSLTQSHITDSYYDKVIELLTLSPFMVRRRTEKKYSFPTLVLEDLKEVTEHVAIDANASSSRFFSSEYTLRQLLEIYFLTFTGTTVKSGPAFNKEKIEKIITNVRRALAQKNVISRTAIVEAMVNSGIKFSQKNAIIRNAIKLRMDILYCRMNCGNHLILEFHPGYEYKGMYQLNCFLAIIKELIDESAGDKLSKELFMNLDGNIKMPYVRGMFISCMADSKEILEMQAIHDDTTDYKNKFEECFVELLGTRKSVYLKELETLQSEALFKEREAS